MREELEIKYGEIMQLQQDCDDYLLKRHYQEMREAIMTLLRPLPYGVKNPITDE